MDDHRTSRSTPPTEEKKRRFFEASTALHMFEEFRFGYSELLDAEKVDEYGSVRIRYHVSALMHMLSNWFLLDRGGFLDRTLRGLGVDREIDGVLDTLKRPVGGSTIGEVIRTSRNAGLVHPKTLVPDEWIAKAEADFQASHTELGQQFPARFHEVCGSVLTLETALLERVPKPLHPPRRRGDR